MMKELIERYGSLEKCEEDIEKARRALISCYFSGGKLLLCGNGGSAADCEHIAGELCKGFLKKRPLGQSEKELMKANCEGLDDILLGKLQHGYPAISLSSMMALNTAFSNDVDPNLIYAQGVLALSKPGDVLMAISTSGNSQNVVAAAKVAKGLGLTVIGLTGNDGGKLSEIADICIRVDEKEAYRIQELHLPVYHYLCKAVEEHFEKE